MLQILLRRLRKLLTFFPSIHWAQAVTLFEDGFSQSVLQTACGKTFHSLEYVTDSMGLVTCRDCLIDIQRKREYGSRIISWEIEYDRERARRY
jgi:hypothetical protein